MASPAEVLVQWLIDEGIGVDPVGSPGADFQAFFSQLPDNPKAPDKAIAVYNTEGFADGRCHRTHRVIVHPGVQFRIRDNEHSSNWGKAEQIVDAVDQIIRQVVVTTSGTYKIQAVTRGPILDLGPEPEARRRISLSINGLVTLEKL